jgi:hypothetical protein
MIRDYSVGSTARRTGIAALLANDRLLMAGCRRPDEKRHVRSRCFADGKSERSNEGCGAVYARQLIRNVPQWFVGGRVRGSDLITCRLDGQKMTCTLHGFNDLALISFAACRGFASRRSRIFFRSDLVRSQVSGSHCYQCLTLRIRAAR